VNSLLLAEEIEERCTAKLFLRHRDRRNRCLAIADVATSAAQDLNTFCRSFGSAPDREDSTKRRPAQVGVFVSGTGNRPLPPAGRRFFTAQTTPLAYTETGGRHARPCQ
jgi:hypothetical protein